MSSSKPINYAVRRDTAKVPNTGGCCQGVPELPAEFSITRFGPLGWEASCNHHQGCDGIELSCARTDCNRDSPAARAS